VRVVPGVAGYNDAAALGYNISFWDFFLAWGSTSGDVVDNGVRKVSSPIED